MHYMWQIIYAIIFIILSSDLFYSSNKVSANKEYKTAQNNAKQNNNTKIESPFLIFFILSVIICLIIYIILCSCKYKWLMTRTHRYEHETMDINEGRNESRDQRINESIDDIRSEDIDDILNGSIDSNWKKSTSDSMQNYVYLSLESMSKRDQAPENHFNYSVSTSIINEMGKNRYKCMNESMNKRKVKHLSLEHISDKYAQRQSFNSDEISSDSYDSI